MDKVGYGVVPEVGACGSAHKSHDILPMEAIMGSIQQPPPCPFTCRDLCWQVELRRTPKHGIKKIPYGKGCLWFMFHGLGF